MDVPQDYLSRPVAVIGAGTLGRRVALMFAGREGWSTSMLDVQRSARPRRTSSSSRSVASWRVTPGGHPAGPNTFRAWRMLSRMHGW